MTAQPAPDPRDRIRDTIHTTLNAGGYWLPIEAQHAIAKHDATAAARVKSLHQQYRFAGDDTTNYCAHCNQISGGWIPWPCPTITALDKPKEQP